MFAVPHKLFVMTLLLTLGCCFVLAGSAPRLADVAQAQGPAPQVGGPTGAPLGTAFTFQGYLNQGQGAANGPYIFRFSLYAEAEGGNPIGLPIERGLQVTSGLFTTTLDFGARIFNGRERYLQISVRRPDEADWTTLTPRQPILATPYALALPGLWTLPNDTAPSLIGGYSGNVMHEGVVGGTISGGGSSERPNQVTADYATISGGLGNQATDFAATVAGGASNQARFSYSTISGGVDNATLGHYAVVGGGNHNIAEGPYSTVGGGLANSADQEAATVAGGYNNLSDGKYATVGGGRTNQATADYATIAGGGRADENDFDSGNHVTDAYGTIGGGGGNRAGNGNNDPTDAQYTTVAGGRMNSVRGTYAVIGGGNENVASGTWSTVAGGARNTASGEANATIGGGQSNEATGIAATVAGGFSNHAEGAGAFVGGGNANFASGAHATTAGGEFNRANGNNSSVPGGSNNTAQGAYSLAAGRRAKALHDGAFVWADATDADIASTRPNQFVVRASGGMSFATDHAGKQGVGLAPGAGAWSTMSDRNAKADFTPVDGEALLVRLAELPVQTWRYQAQDAGVRHIGPTAQEFHAAFGVGEDETRISTVDADGVALAAVQALNRRDAMLTAEVSALRQRVDKLERQNSALEARLAALERGVNQEASGASPLLLVSGVGLFTLVAAIGWVWRSRREV